MKYRIAVFLSLVGFFVLCGSSFALAEQVEWGLGLLEPASENARLIYDFHTTLMWIISVITVFVFVLLVIVVLRYNRRANPKPSTVTHNVLLEIVWTVVPVVILIVIAIPSFDLLYKNDKIEKPDMTLKAIGYQWYWGYEYIDYEGLAFDARMVPDEEIGVGQKRLLSTDNVVVLPVDTNISLLVTANDVIHAWTIPAFGVKMDAVPGRMNETWFRITKPGTYYGRCSEICGRDHAYMPIEVRAVSKEEFARWVEKAKIEFAANDNAPIKVTALQVREGQ